MGSKKKVATNTKKVGTMASPPLKFSPVFFWFSLVLLVAGVFMQGYYWPLQNLAVVFITIFSGIIFFYAQQKGEVRSLVLTLPQAAALVILAIYLLGLIRPVSANLSMQAVLFWVSVVLLYFAWVSRPLSEKQQEQLVAALVAAGGVLAVVGLAIYTKVVAYPSWLVGNRLSAGFEYPNVTAGYFVLVLILAWHSGLWASSAYKRLLYTFVAIVALVALFFTYSRGGWLVAAVSLGLLGLFSLRQHFLRTSIYAAWCLGAGAVAVVVALRWTNTFGFFALLAVALVAGAVPMLKLRLNSKLARSLLVGGLVAAAAAVGVALYAQRLFLQERLAWALQRFDLTVMAQDGRLVFFRDGLSVLYQSPLIGHGGGAWRALYVRVQSFHYGSARMHSDPLEILLETGLLGVVAYAIWLGVPLWYGMKSKNKLHQGVAFALVGFLLHSSIDAFLGFPVFYYILAVLLAVISPRTPVFRLKMPALLAASGKTLVTVCLSVILLVTGMLWLSEAEERWGVQPAVARNDHAGVTESLRRAVLMNPFESRRRIDYFRMLEQTGATRASLEAQLELAARFEPHDPRVTNTIGNFYLARRDFAAALRYFNRSLEQQPMNIQNYESLAFAYLLAATDAAAAGRPVGGYLEGVLAVQERFSATVAATEPRLLAQSALAFVSTPLMEATKGGRLVLLGDVNEAVTVLEKQQLVGDAVAREVAVAWLARAYQLLGRTAAAEALIAKQGDAESFRQYLAQVRAATVER